MSATNSAASSALFGGGLVYDRLGSYNAAWQFGVTLGLVAGLVQIAIVWGRVPRPPAFSA